VEICSFEVIYFISKIRYQVKMAGKEEGGRETSYEDEARQAGGFMRV